MYSTGDSVSWNCGTDHYDCPGSHSGYVADVDSDGTITARWDDGTSDILTPGTPGLG